MIDKKINKLRLVQERLNVAISLVRFLTALANLIFFIVLVVGVLYFNKHAHGKMAS